MPLRTLIVDDEPIARKVLRDELHTIGGIEVTGEAESGKAALAQISAQRPDLVLLDLQMPEMSGMEVIRGIRRGAHLPVFVIVTAYDRYALEAFEAGAVDYLLKPVRRERLAEALERARNLTALAAAERLAHLQEVGGAAFAAHPKKIVAKVGEEFLLLSADEIYAFQADGELVWILTGKNRYLATQTLKTLERDLKDHNFRRIHRGVLINVNQVRKMSALSSQRWLVTLRNQQQFIASKRLARNIRQIFRQERA